MTTPSQMPEHSRPRHGLLEEEGGRQGGGSTKEEQKHHHDTRSLTLEAQHVASHAYDSFGLDTPDLSPLVPRSESSTPSFHTVAEHLKQHVRAAGLLRVSEGEDEATGALITGPDRSEREYHSSALEDRNEHRPHYGRPTTTTTTTTEILRHTVLDQEADAHDDDNAAPPHPHLQLPRRSPRGRGSSPPSPTDASVAAGGGEVGTSGHQRPSSAPVKPLKSAFAAPKSPPLACSSPSSETEGGGSGATSPSSGTKKRARFEDDGGVGSGDGESSLMLGRGLGAAAPRALSLRESEEEAGFAENVLDERDDDREELVLSSSPQVEVEDDDDAGDPDVVHLSEASSEESVRDVLQADVDDAANEFQEDAAEREDASMGEQDSGGGEDAVRDDEGRDLDLEDDIVSPPRDRASDRESSYQEDEGNSRLALADHGQARDTETGSIYNRHPPNAEIGRHHQSSDIRPLASTDEGKATNRAQLPLFAHPLKLSNIRRLSDSQAEREARDAHNVPRRASSMGDFNRLQGRSILRPLQAKAAPAGPALTATSVHPAEQPKIKPIYQHPNARWRHDVYDSRRPSRTEQTVYSGGTEYHILWEEPPQSDTDSDTTLIMEESLETPQVVEPDGDSILAHISRSPSPMGKVRTKLAAWSWAKEQEKLGMEDEQDEDEAGQAGGRGKATSHLMPAAGATCLLSTRRRSPIEDATGSEGPPAPPNTLKSGASSAQRSAPQTPFLECRDEGGQCGIRVEEPDGFDPDTGHSVESQGEFLDADAVGQEGEEDAGLNIGLGSLSDAADMHRLIKPALSRVRSATLPPAPATTTTTTLDYLSFPATVSSSRLPGPSLLSSSILQQQQQQQHRHLANPSFSRHFSNLTPEEEDRFKAHRDSVDIHHRRLNEDKLNTHLQATRDSFLITKSKYDARLLRPQTPYLQLQHPHQHPSSPTHIQYSRFGGLSPILDASPPSSEATTTATTTKQSVKAASISSASRRNPSGEVPVKVTVLEGEESEEDESDSAHPDEHVGCAICAVERPRWFEATHRRKMQV
ncbi:hypothetical protein KC327_g15447 [Hortaea werneckii]|nr:hypothetical protein KC350_g16904 [Hortaea werneckii]KAI6848600.1 hypothetical protein KC358_g1697 [Hortaea werneckii]KAI6899786.1 hypothetical protein KC348_g17033 [Hortaea werneckii]KAI6919880.1 hypothetical protein KC341_g16993 [Hortaea werneckii]KAI6953404.1 hypothetical protein KC321_g16982 [Hortaea werneckii]